MMDLPSVNYQVPDEEELRVQFSRPTLLPMVSMDEVVEKYPRRPPKNLGDLRSCGSYTSSGRSENSISLSACARAKAPHPPSGSILRPRQEGVSGYLLPMFGGVYPFPEAGVVVVGPPSSGPSPEDAGRPLLAMPRTSSASWAAPSPSPLDQGRHMAEPTRATSQ